MTGRVTAAKISTPSVEERVGVADQENGRHSLLLADKQPATRLHQITVVGRNGPLPPVHTAGVACSSIT